MCLICHYIHSISSGNSAKVTLIRENLQKNVGEHPLLANNRSCILSKCFVYDICDFTPSIYEFCFVFIIIVVQSIMIHLHVYIVESSFE